jgi:chemotaxis protein MotA
MNMVLQGVAMMANKRSPGLMRETLKSFVAHYQNDLRDEPVRSARALIPLGGKPAHEGHHASPGSGDRQWPAAR